MPLFLSPFFIACCTLFVLHQVLQLAFGIYIPLVHAYLDNLLSMPIILTLLVAERRYLFKRGVHYQFSFAEVVIATVYVSVVSEFLLPLLSNRFVYDPVDFVFYFLGTSLYLFSLHGKSIRFWF